MSVFEYSFFLLVGFIPIYNLVCTILNNNQQDFDKLNIKINMLIYSSEQLKTKVENIIKTKIDTTSHEDVVEESPLEENSTVIEENSTVVQENSTVVEETSSPIDTFIQDESDIDFVQDRVVKNDKPSQNLSYFISSKLTNISSNFF